MEEQKYFLTEEEKQMTLKEFEDMLQKELDAIDKKRFDYYAKEPDINMLKTFNKDLQGFKNERYEFEMKKRAKLEMFKDYKAGIIK